MNQKLTQQKRIIEALKANNNVLQLNQVLDLKISQYGTRIKELRAKGYVIKNEIIGTFGGVRHTKYTLVSEPKEYISEPIPKPEGFASNSHRIAHENRLKNNENQYQLRLI